MRLFLLTMSLATTGCLDVIIPWTAPEVTPSSIDQPTIPGDVFATLKDPIEAHAELCDNDGTHPDFPNDADRITKEFCQDLVPGGSIPQPKGLADLLKLLGLEFKDPAGENGAGGNPGFALLGHSSALTARKVSTLTPTAFVFTPPNADGTKPTGFVFVAFDPGEQFVEVASHDPVSDEVNLYLVLFDKECNHAPGGCTPNDLLTQNLITGWSNIRIYESETALNNTIADCRQCHAPNDADPQILRMQENSAPFTHWFSKATKGGKSLLDDFHAAHGTDEDYGPIPAALIDKSDPAKFAKLVADAGFAAQPNPFPSAQIEAQVYASAPQQPAMNMPPGHSDTWGSVYDNGAAALVITAPYHDVKVTDPTKLADMSEKYRQWKANNAIQLPDIRDVFLDSGLRDMGFAPKLGLDGRGLLVQMCQQCHNANLDMTITREKFLVDRLDEMSREEKDIAIERLAPSDMSRLRMPPLLFKTITERERQLMIEELQK